MPVRTRKNAPITSDKEKSIAIALKAYREDENKSINFKKQIEMESKKLSSLLKLLQMHQAKLKGNTEHARENPEGTKKWYGAPLPSLDSLQSLCQMLNKDLEITELYTGCAIEQCNVVLLSDTKDEIKRQFDATGKVGNIEFDLLLESVFQILTGKERVSRVVSVVFRPPLPELLPLQHCLQHTASTYLLPRALHTLQDIERDQHRLRRWSDGRQGLEVVVSRLSLVLCYVPFLNQQQQVAPSARQQASSSPRKDSRARLAAIKTERDVSKSSDSALPGAAKSMQSLSLRSEDDMTVKLDWAIKFCDHRKNFLSSFKLEVLDEVLVRYSQSPIQPLLAKKKKFSTGNDVIELFSALCH